MRPKLLVAMRLECSQKIRWFEAGRHQLQSLSAQIWLRQANQGLVFVFPAIKQSEIVRPGKTGPISTV
jgi:hypothetical protein